MRRSLVLAILLSGSLSTGCVLFMPDRILYEFDGSAHPPVHEQTCKDVSGRRMFGVALSGGGSRAAVFAAAGLEALWEHGLLDRITHVSSVSGGSMASSYLVANKPTCNQREDEADREKCWHAFFADFQDAMRRNYINRVELRQLMPNRFLSPTRRALSLEEELDKRFLHDKTFSEIPAGPASPGEPARPVLLINATSYDAGRRFVFSNACLPEVVPPEAVAARRSRSQADAREAIEMNGLRALSFSSQGCARPTPGDLPVSLAVATSAAFPPLMGPVTIQSTDSCVAKGTLWWHLGDGGIIENSGIDTLEEVVLRDRAAGGPLDQVVLLSLDAGKKTKAMHRWALRTVDMWTSPAGVSTVVDAPRVAARAYHDLFWKNMQAELKRDGIQFDAVVLGYTMAKLDHWPKSCPQKAEPPQPEDFEAIDTDLKISTCHADLLTMAARQLVEQQLNGEMGRRLEAMGIPVRRVND